MRKVFFAIAIISALFLSSCNSNDTHNMIRVMNLKDLADKENPLVSLQLKSDARPHYDGDTVVVGQTMSGFSLNCFIETKPVVFPKGKMEVQEDQLVSMITYTKMVIMRGGDKMPSVNL
ncbi:MAG: hypothetical protein JWM20_857 [Patescibacteria group bacterium]|nr:hypothetical protein [Patescibacteria group bacterium]